MEDDDDPIVASVNWIEGSGLMQTLFILGVGPQVLGSDQREPLVKPPENTIKRPLGLVF